MSIYKPPTPPTIMLGANLHGASPSQPNNNGRESRKTAMGRFFKLDDNGWQNIFIILLQKFPI